MCYCTHTYIPERGGWPQQASGRSKGGTTTACLWRALSKLSTFRNPLSSQKRFPHVLPFLTKSYSSRYPHESHGGIGGLSPIPWNAGQVYIPHINTTGFPSPPASSCSRKFQALPLGWSYSVKSIAGWPASSRRFGLCPYMPLIDLLYF